jgi:CYTH domain-containing protein
MRRLGKKADVDAATRLITSLYLSEAEFALFAHLPGERIHKTRHYLEPIDGVALSVDRFEGRLEGLILAEAEFETEAALRAYAGPDFATREVTDDPRYGGGRLAACGLPAD